MPNPNNSLSLEQKNVQRQVGLPLTLQLMHLVEIPYASLEQEIRNVVDDNPALEIDDEDDGEVPAENTDDTPREEYDDNGDPLELSNEQLPDDEIFNEEFYRDSEDYDDGFSDQQLEKYIAKQNAPDDSLRNPKAEVYYESVRERWQWQLGEMDMTDRQAQIATYLMGTLDDSGYLHADLQAIVNELLFTENLQTNREEVEYVLTHFVQELDPPGTGARTLQECLLLQLDRIPDQTPAHVNARILIRTLENAVTIPPSAVQLGASGSFVFVVDADNTARKREVKTGISTGAITVIESGLKAGETVVVDGVDRLRDGTKVRVAAVVETVRMPDGTRPHATEKGPEAIAPMPQGGAPAGPGGPGRGPGGMRGQGRPDGAPGAMGAGRPGPGNPQAQGRPEGSREPRDSANQGTSAPAKGAGP